MKPYRSPSITIGAFTLVAGSSLALAQPSVDCKKTETQAECHARLRCKADEDVGDCQQRLRAAGSGQQNGGDGNDRGDRGDRGDGGDRGDRSDRGDRGDRGDRRSRRQRGRGGERRNRSGGSGFQANKTFGLGLELGEPSGLNGKYFLSDARALDFGVGVIYEHYYYGDGVHLYLDHLWHPVSLVSSPALELPLYIGVGVRYWSFDECYDDPNFCDGGSALGLRIPIGISFDFNNVPLDIFLQFTPVIDVIFGDYYDRFDDRNHFGIDGTVGIRFWFK